MTKYQKKTRQRNVDGRYEFSSGKMEAAVARAISERFRGKFPYNKALRKSTVLYFFTLAQTQIDKKVVWHFQVSFDKASGIWQHNKNCDLKLVLTLHLIIACNITTDCVSSEKKKTLFSIKNRGN